MVKPRDKIIVGLSGGKDSISLLYNLMKVQEKTYQTEPLIALTIDEGIHNYKGNNIKCAGNFCKRYGIEHRIVSFKEKVGMTLDEIISLKKQTDDYKYACNYCALIRRRLLNEEAKKLGGNVLALGHNLTDMAETFLMNVLYKRTQLIANQYLFKKENSEIAKVFVKKITPLMRIPEEEIYQYANLKKFEYFSLHCPYRDQDPIIRKRILDFIQECKIYSPEIEFNLFNGFLELSEILYDRFENKPFSACQKCGYPSGTENMCSYCEFVQALDK